MRLVIILFTLAGCVNWDQVENQKCIDLGYQTGTELYLKCRQTLAQERLRKAEVLSNIGNKPCHACAALPQWQRPPVNCRAVTVGNVTRMHCF